MIFQLKRNKRFEELVYKDQSVYFTRAEPIHSQMKKHLQFIDSKDWRAAYPEINDEIAGKTKSHHKSNIFKNDAFWLIKGIENTASKEVEWAIDFYKQSLHINFKNFNSAYNLAWEYEKLDSLNIAKEWYEYCTQLDDKSQMSYCGVALWSYK